MTISKTNCTSSDIQKVNLTSSNLSAEKLTELYRILPDVFSENKVDFDKLRAILGGDVAVGSEKFSFSWAGKSNAIKNVLVPSRLTLNPSPSESIKFDSSENLFIEGDNLEVLKLLQKAYFEKVKMIYIDPPYNTGHDFVYNDDFSSPLDNYLRQTGQKNGDGDSTTTNKETNGRYHSDWLSMMYPRLKLAWNLLREDGVIFVSIDDNEVHHLRMIMDEIFGEENFIVQFVWEKHKAPKNDNKFISENHEYILMYGKNKNATKINLLSRTKKNLNTFSNPDNDSRGDWASGPLLAPTFNQSSVFEIKRPNGNIVLPPKGKCWSFSKERINELILDKRIFFGESGNNVPRIKRFLSELPDGIVPTSVLLHDDLAGTQKASNLLKDIFSDQKIFSYPKPIEIIMRFLEISTLYNSNDIILDFFAGSGTTAHAILKQNQEDNGNRKFICVQLPEKLDKDSEGYKAGYKTIADISKERIRRVINGYGDNPQPIDAGFKVFRLSESNYPENKFVFDSSKPQEEQQKEFIAYLHKAKQNELFDKENDTSIVYENIVKEGLSLNSVVAKVSVGKNTMYQVTDGQQQLLICLEDKLAPDTVKELTDKSRKDKLFICLESSLDDTTAANLALNLDLKTI